MTIQKKWHGHKRLASTLVLSVACATASFAAVSVTDVAIAPDAGGGVKLSYRLNQAATSVSIQVAGGATVTGGTAKGLNTVTLPAGSAGKTATITAAAPAPNGAGGAEVIIPVTSPDNRATASSTNLVAVDVNKRIGSPYLGHIYLPTGFSQTGNRYLWVYAPDGTLVQSKNLVPISDQASFPYGFAVAHADTQDRLVIHNRSGSKNYVLGPDLALIASQGSSSLYPGLAITPNPDNSAQPWNFWQANSGLDGSIRRYTSDLSTNAGSTLAAASLAQETGSSSFSFDIAVDDANTVLFKTQGGNGSGFPITAGSVNKWTSSDNGATWTEDTSWRDNFVAAVGADLAAAESTLTTASIMAGGVSLAKGFNSSNPGASSVWVAASGGAAEAFWNRIYKVNAVSGAIEQTINVQDVVVPEGSIAIKGKAVQYLEADAFGNVVFSLRTGTVLDPRQSRYFAALAPNADSNSFTLSGVDLTLPLTATGAVDKGRVANTGNQQVTYTINAFSNAGIVADNVQVTANLTAIKGGDSVALTRGTVSGDGKSAAYTLTYTVPADVDLTNSGSFDIPFKVTANSNTAGITTRVTQVVYNAYAPSWTVTTAGAVNSSAVTNGSTAYIGDDAGNVYAIDATTGAPAANFGGGSGTVSVGGPVLGQVQYMRGRLYVATPTTVYILNGGTGARIASKDIANVSSVAVDPAAADSVFVAAGNTIVRLNSLTAAQEAVSADFGAKVNRVAVIPSLSYTALIVAGTEGEPSGDNAGKNGKVLLLMAGDLTAANGTDPAVATDANGAVRSKADWASSNGATYITIGGASGEYYINADTLTLEPWTANSGGGGNLGGNPYTGGRVDANPAFPRDVTSTEPGGREATRIAFATTAGNVVLLNAANGERVSYGGYPVALTTVPGSGFAAGAGILAVNPSASGARTLYIGSDATDQKFYALDTKPDDVSYAAAAAKRHIFDPTDASAFPGAVAGAFNSTPALSVDKVVVGSAAKRVYGFPSLTATRPGAISVTPANGANGVSTNPTVTVVFNADISTATLDPYNYTILTDEAGTVVDSTVSLGPDNKSIVFQPNSPLQANKTYSVVIKSEAGVQPFSSLFYTGVPAAVKGDVNGDGVFDKQDVAAALRIAGGLQPATAAAITATGNKVTPGSITIEDAVFLGQVLAGKASF